MFPLMNDHNLDDLIIDTISPKSNKTKGFLTIIALFIVVLIVTIILTKTLLKSPESSELNFEDNLSEMIAPELKLQETPKEVKVSKPKDVPSLSAIIEDKINTPEVVKSPETVKEVSAPKIMEEETVTVTEEKVEVATPEVVKPIKKETVTPKVEVKKPIVKPTVKPVKKPTTKAATKPKVSKAPKSTVSGKYYVQVGSFKENPSTRFLSVIKSSGFKYHVTKPDRTGYKKLLIGPYKTRAEVDKARDVIRDRIHKSAFVVQK